MSLLSADLQLLKPGKQITDRYQILEIIGNGAMGTVVQARDQELEGEIIALKFLHPHLASDPKTLSRFHNEVLLTRQLSHPNIVRVYDLDRIEKTNLYYLSMECIHGPNLREFLDFHKGTTPKLEDTIRILHQIALGLSYAHKKKIIHRDIKPSNILLDTTGNAKLSDFGIARSLIASHGLTHTGEALGTPLYMSPEHFQSDSPDAQSDIYSLAVIAFEMATGKLPFPDQSILVLAQNHLENRFPRKPLEDAKVPPWYFELVDRSSEKKKESRFQDCGEFVEFLHQHASDSMIRPQIQLNKQLHTKYTKRHFLPPRTTVLFRVFFVILIFGIISWELLDNNSNVRLLTSVYRLEQLFSLELSSVKSLFGLGNASILDKEDLLKVTREQRLIQAKSLLEANADPDIFDSEGNTATHHAAVLGNIELLRMLLDYQPNLNRVNSKGETPLHSALKHNKTHSALQIVSYPLVSPPRDLCIPDQDGNTPLHLAALNQQSQVIFHALNLPFKNICLWHLNKNGDTAIHIAVKNLDHVSLEKLLNFKTNPDLRDRFGRTPLMLAFQDFDVLKLDLVMMLHRAGARLGVKDESGNPISSYAKDPAAKALFTMLKSGNPLSSYANDPAAKALFTMLESRQPL